MKNRYFEDYYCYRTVQSGQHHGGTSAVEITLQAARSSLDARPVQVNQSQVTTKTLQLGQQPVIQQHGGQKIVMATTTIPPSGHPSISVAIAKPGRQDLK